jgi:hypothetical protein
MGFKPDTTTSTRRHADPARAEAFFREAATLAQRMLGALPSHRELITHIQAHGLSRI